MFYNTINVNGHNTNMFRHNEDVIRRPKTLL